ncbi:hypothetical protein DACRYDRAFT_112447 [Dacryopinax primogenitus]|uniref:Uncharacterized protein n=1 Tax=Dacryopinax primogenitus (strain DJM 731) TaxID=1858805 RepID=M5FZA0_DACPD|nr:uncharacterized protein DACRYDRAFT_112447 [Dacryopinax primogenitus]EJT96832.1 hypothetical protein DACRYDRAFT_112447 [Dacryopinax primogenitus]
MNGSNEPAQQMDNDIFLDVGMATAPASPLLDTISLRTTSSQPAFPTTCKTIFQDLSYEDSIRQDTPPPYLPTSTPDSMAAFAGVNQMLDALLESMDEQSIGNLLENLDHQIMALDPEPFEEEENERGWEFKSEAWSEWQDVIDGEKDGLAEEGWLDGTGTEAAVHLEGQPDTLDDVIDVDSLGILLPNHTLQGTDFHNLPAV